MRSFHVLGKKIIGVASNYKCHIQEMKSAIPKEPIFFLKPTSSYVLEPHPIMVPEGHEVHHEVELGVVIGRKGRNIRVEEAFSHIAGYTLALDLTARDLQATAKAEGRPWTCAKGFDTFCPVSTYVNKETLTDNQNIDLWLRVNGELRQKGNTGDMLFSISELISQISRVMRLDPGDLILTGTPAGVGPIKVGDTVTAGMGYDVRTVRFKVVPKPKVLKR